MTSYFDEHDCLPLADGERPDIFVHLARLLLDTGLASQWQDEYERMTGQKPKVPPASKAFIDGLPTVQVQETNGKCVICLAAFEEKQILKKLPCDHEFHDKCILPWLSKTSSCPLCRQEMPTDDPEYEQYKEYKKREGQRKFQVDSLHDSMFG